MTSDRFPRSSRYNPEWLLASASGGANPLWLTEWLTEAMTLRPGMRVLDLGCGRAASSIFLAREFDVQVWAADLWFSAAENAQRIADAGVADRVFPLQADARALPFSEGYFDAVICVDSFVYFATDDLYLNYISWFLQPGGQLGFVGAGLTQEIPGKVPEHLRPWWSSELWSLHSAAWWRRHWEKMGYVDVTVADTIEDGWRYWLQWQRAVAPENLLEIDTVTADRGGFLGYVRMAGRRQPDSVVADPRISIPAQYVKRPLLRTGG